jgi:hypothetical protein
MACNLQDAVPRYLAVDCISYDRAQVFFLGLTGPYGFDKHLKGLYFQQTTTVVSIIDVSLSTGTVFWHHYEYGPGGM